MEVMAQREREEAKDQGVAGTELGTCQLQKKKKKKQ
jgi:hypothetical protein